MKKNILFVVLIVMLMTGCLSKQEEAEAVFYATQNAEYGVVPPPKYQTLAAEYYGLRLTATPMPTSTPNPNWTPTTNSFQYAQTADAMVRGNEMTAQAQQQAFEMQRLKAEQAAEAAKETAQAHSDMMTAQARATFMQATSSANETHVAYTAVAQSTATERALFLQFQGTATAFAETQIVQPTHAIWTMEAAKIQQTLEAGEAEKVRLAVERQKSKNMLDAFLPWGIILGLTVVSARGMVEYVKTRTHTRDEHGRQPLIERKTDDGSSVYIKPEAMETGIVKVTKDGAVMRYAPMDKEEQSDINKRNQFVDGIAALPDSYAQKAPGLMMSGFNAEKPARPQIEVVEPVSVRDWVDDVTRQVDEMEV